MANLKLADAGGEDGRAAPRDVAVAGAGSAAAAVARARFQPGSFVCLR